MARSGGDVVAIAGIVAAQRPVGALDDPLRAFDDAVERRAQNLVERIVEGGAARRFGHGRSVGLHRTAEAGEAPLGTGYDFAIQHNFAAVISAAARMLTSEAAARGKRAHQRHFPILVLLEPDNTRQRLAG